jgi:triosephosphate isomerase
MTPKKKFIVLSNWKMHKIHKEALDWIESLGKGASELTETLELVVCVPYVHLRAVSNAAKKFSQISPGAQNVNWETAGAFTGEISAPMLADAGAQYCVVGHPERRVYFAENDEMVNRKSKLLLQSGINPVVCIGESIEQRNRALTFNQIERQVITCLEGFTEGEMRRTVVLYEPIWSIGTGNNATPQQAQEAHQFIRNMLESIFSKETAQATRIMYGGSVKTHIVEAIIKGEDIDGVGAGSGSLNIQDFLKIARSCSNYLQ